jgi:hypothetical protein
MATKQQGAQKQQASESAEKAAETLVNTFKPFLTAMESALKTHVTVEIANDRSHTTAEVQRCLLEIGKINTRLDTLEQLMAGEKKKPAGRATAATKVAETTAGNTTGDKPAPTTTTKKFPSNKMIYFRERIQKDEEYRKKIIDVELAGLIANDAGIQGKTNPDQKKIAEALYCWSHIRDKKPEMLAQVELDYKADKAAHEEANKPAQQTAETRTPPNEPADK